ncbi:MAG: hypothetical protein WC682_01285 [Parcubacteria group bacterium]|jgi:hypothetical protein
MDANGIFWIVMGIVGLTVYFVAVTRPRFHIYASNADLAGLPGAIIATAISLTTVGVLIAIIFLSGLATKYEIVIPLQ